MSLWNHNTEIINAMSECVYIVGESRPCCIEVSQAS